MRWTTEAAYIIDAARYHHLDPALIAAIRRAENGGPGREYGILHPGADSYATQLEFCCNTIKHALTDCKRERPAAITNHDGAPYTPYTTAFLAYLARRYAPANADNDPTNLNQNWLHNVLAIYHDITSRGLTDPHFSDLA